MIHETAIVDEGADIGHDTSIWHWSHICKGAKIEIAVHLVKMYSLVIEQ